MKIQVRSFTRISTDPCISLFLPAQSFRNSVTLAPTFSSSLNPPWLIFVALLFSNLLFSFFRDNVSKETTALNLPKDDQGTVPNRRNLKKYKMGASSRTKGRRAVLKLGDDEDVRKSSSLSIDGGTRGSSLSTSDPDVDLNPGLM